MTTVYFYFSFPTVPTDISNTSKFKRKEITSSTQPCSSDIEYDSIIKNMFSNWSIGSASCSFEERCLSGTRCCNTGCPIHGCNKTCKGESYTGKTCAGYNPSACGCSGSFGSHPITRYCSYVCFYPPTDTLCYPGATKSEYISGRKDTSSNSSYYVFKATYNISTFTTPAQLVQIEANLRENDGGLSDDQKQKNTEQLNILKKMICTSSNILTAPCTTYCAPSTTSSSSLPVSNCTDAWKTFCAYGDNIMSEECQNWCAVNSNGQTNCKDTYNSYCNTSSNFTKNVCQNYYKTQYINDQLTDEVQNILTAQCSRYADSNGNVIDSDGNMVESGLATSKYPVNTCACFLPSNVYDTFYGNITKDYPDLRGIFSINQCSYPDCANTSAIQPKNPYTCPNVAITSCVINNTVGGNVTNSNFNVVNNCITQVETTGTYSSNNTNIAPSQGPQKVETVKAVAPPPQYTSGSGTTTTSSTTTGEENVIFQNIQAQLVSLISNPNIFYYTTSFLVIVVMFFMIGTIYYWKSDVPPEESLLEVLIRLFFRFIAPLIMILLVYLLTLSIEKIKPNDS